jgi:hypothetical protein
MKFRRVATGPDVNVTYDRMVEIVSLIEPTKSLRPEVEYSALLGVAASIIAARMGIEPKPENTSAILSLLISKIVPELEAELKKR